MVIVAKEKVASFAETTSDISLGEVKTVFAAALIGQSTEGAATEVLQVAGTPSQTPKRATIVGDSTYTPA